MEKYLFLSFDSSGAPYEGPDYAGALAFLTFVAEALRRRGAPNFLANNRFERLLEYLMYELLPGGGRVNNLNDAKEECGSIVASLPLMGTSRGNLLPWLAKQLNLHPARTQKWLEDEQAAIEPSYGGQNLLAFLLWWKEDAPVRDPHSLGYPLSHCFQTRGVASMRTGWEPSDWLVSHFCGRQELWCHHQADYNHVAFYAMGEKFLVDAGYGFEIKDPAQPVNYWFRQTTAHNCVLIDGLQHRGWFMPAVGWAEGEMLDFQHGKQFDTSLGDASSCTGADHRVLRALRRVVLLREAPRPYLAVVDVNEHDGGTFLSEALWHTGSENRIEIDGTRFVIKGKTNECLGRVLWPANATLAIAENFGRPQLRVSTRTAVSEVVTVFCPLQRGTKPPDFSCERKSEGFFIIQCSQEGGISRLHVNAATQGPLRSPWPVKLEE